MSDDYLNLDDYDVDDDYLDVGDRDGVSDASADPLPEEPPDGIYYEETTVDFRAGNGSLDADAPEVDSSYPDDHGPDDKHLGFNPADASPQQREKYEEAAETYRNQYTDGHDYDESRKLRDAMTFASRLDMSKRNRDRVGYLLERLNLGDEGSPPLEEAILAMIAYVWRDDDVPIDNPHIVPKTPEGDESLTDPPSSIQDTFVDLCEDLCVEPADVRRIRSRLQPQLDNIK